MKPVPGWFRYTSYVMAALLVTCVVLQYNDPDPIRWMLMYGAGAIASAVLPSKKPVAWVGLAIAAFALVWAAMLFFEIYDKMEVSDLVNKMSEKGGAVEEGRESGGLAIEGAWLLIASVFRLRRA